MLRASGSKGASLSSVEREKVSVLPSTTEARDALVASTATSHNLRGDAITLPLRPASVASPFAAMLTATKTDNLSSSTTVNPGGTIMYTIEITNTGNADAMNVQLMDTLDANVMLVAGSVKVSPIAVNDAYNTIGNVNISLPAPVLWPTI